MSTCSLTVLRLIDRFRSRNLEPGDPTVLTVFLDIAAAFDIAKHDALHSLLVSVFPNSNFAELVQNLTTRGLACVSVNGFKSDYFMLTCGTGQGDPLSSPRFLIVQHFFIMALFKYISKPEIGITVPLPIDGVPTEQVPPVLFADDSTIWLNFQTQQQIDHWKHCLEVLHSATGLRINPSKTKIIPLKEVPPDLLPLVEQVGEVVDEVEHLGIIICRDPEVGRARTYERLAVKFRSRSKMLRGLIRTTDVFHRRLMVQSLVSSLLLHVYRVYPAELEFLEHARVITLESLWYYEYDGESRGRPKVAAARVGAPLKAGGLNMVLPEEAAKASFIGALISVIYHGADAPECILNKLFSITNTIPRIQHWGADSIISDADWILELVPSSGWYLAELSDLLQRMESDPLLFLHTPIRGAEFTKYWRWTPEQFDEHLPDAISYFHLMQLPSGKRRGPVRLQPHRLARLEDEEERVRVRVEGLVEVLNELGLTVPPRRGAEWEYRQGSTFFQYAILYNKGVFKKAMKRYRRLGGIQEPPAYRTRIYDGVDVPRNIVDFKAAYTFLGRAHIESKFKSFQFELLNRTLMSINKSYNMGLRDSNLCPTCPLQISDTSHAVTDCKIPTWFLRFFSRFARNNHKLSEYTVQETIYEFSIPRPKIISHQLEEQLQHIFIAIKEFSLNAQFHPRFPRWNDFVIYAKILNIIKRVYRVRMFSYLPYDLLDDFLNFLLSIEVEVRAGF